MIRDGCLGLVPRLLSPKTPRSRCVCLGSRPKTFFAYFTKSDMYGVQLPFLVANTAEIIRVMYISRSPFVMFSLQVNQICNTWSV